MVSDSSFRLKMSAKKGTRSAQPQLMNFVGPPEELPLADLPNANALKQAKYQIEILPWPRVSSIAALFAHSLHLYAFDASAFKVHNCTIFLCSLDVGK